MAFLYVALRNGAGKDGIAVGQGGEIEAVIDAHGIEVHGSFVSYQGLSSRCTFRNRQIIAVIGLFLCPAIAVPIEVHGNRARTGQGLSRKAGAGTIGVTQIDESIIRQIRQRTVAGDIPNCAIFQGNIDVRRFVDRGIFRFFLITAVVVSIIVGIDIAIQIFVIIRFFVINVLFIITVRFVITVLFIIVFCVLNGIYFFNILHFRRTRER